MTTKKWNESKEEREKHLTLSGNGVSLVLNLPGNGRQVLFSFGLAVAAFIPGRGYFRTSEKWSPATTGHINRWIDGEATTVPQSEIDAILYGADHEK